MAHYAELDQNNIVLRVIPGVDENLLDGEDCYSKFTGKVWKRTSYNTLGNVHLSGGVPYRKNYAGIGYMYRADIDAFIPPQPYPSWTLNTDTCLWECPVPHPDDGKHYTWTEKTLAWVGDNT